MTTKLGLLLRKLDLITPSYSPPGESTATLRAHVAERNSLCRACGQTVTG